MKNFKKYVLMLQHEPSQRKQGRWRIPKKAAVKTKPRKGKQSCHVRFFNH